MIRRIHLELPALGWPDGLCPDVGNIQVLRAVQRPLISQYPYEDYGVASLADQTTRPNAVVQLRDGCRWHDGKPVSAEEIVDGIVKGMTHYSGMSRLMGIEAVECISTSRVRISLRKSNRLLGKFLSHPAFSPRRVNEKGGLHFCGAFRPETGGRFISHEGGAEADELEFFVSSEANEALEEFSAGRLDMTCPTAFDIAEIGSSDLLFRASEPDIHAFLLLNPTRVGTLAHASARALVIKRIQCPRELRSVLMPEHISDLGNTIDKYSEVALTIYFADHWPNREIANTLSRTLSGARLQGVTLDELLHRLAGSDFDAALILAFGVFGVKDTLLLTLASMAMTACSGKALRDVEERAHGFLSEPSDSGSWNGLAYAVHHHVPVIPAFRFRSGYLAKPDLPQVPLVHGCIYPLEILASAKYGRRVKNGSN